MNNDKDYIKVSVRVKREEYNKYKKEMIDKHTTPTADINRHIKYIISQKSPN